MRRERLLLWPVDQTTLGAIIEMDSMCLSEVETKLSKLVILSPYHSLP